MVLAGPDRIGRIPRAVLHAAAFLLFVGAWWALSVTAGHGFVPSPLETARAAVRMAGDGSLEAATLQSFFSLTAGYLLAIVVAIPVGMAMGGISIVGAVLNPYVDALSSMPRIAFLPLIIVFLGLGYEAKIFMVFLGAVMPILINTYAGVLHSDAELIEMARSAGAGPIPVWMTLTLTFPMLPRHAPEHAGRIVQQFEVARANTEFSTAQIICARCAVNFLRDDAFATDELVQRGRK